MSAAWTWDLYQKKLPVLVASRRIARGMKYYLDHHMPTPADCYLHLLNGTPLPGFEDDARLEFAKFPGPPS